MPALRWQATALTGFAACQTADILWADQSGLNQGSSTQNAPADGSTTHTLDLRAPSASRRVLLNFDLLGFGPADSTVTRA